MDNIAITEIEFHAPNITTPLKRIQISLQDILSQLDITKNRTKYDLCKFCFANRIVNIWNSFPSYVVSAETVNCFKTRLDRFWLNQDIICVLKFTEQEAEVKLQ